MVFFFNVTATTEIYTYLHTLSLHDALPITFAREGYNAQLSIAYISLINTVNNIAERDQFLGRPIINVTDEGHIITKNPLLAPYVVKITKMWRKRSEEHTSELQSLMRISYAVFCLKKKNLIISSIQIP